MCAALSGCTAASTSGHKASVDADANKASVDAEWTFAPGANSSLFPVYYSNDLGLLLVSDDLATVTAGDSQPPQIYALDPDTGRAVWIVDTESESAEAFFTVPGAVIAVMRPSAASLQPASSLQVWALSSTDGQVLWRAGLTTGAQVLGLSGDSLVTLGTDGITALSTATGGTGWTDGAQAGCDDVAGAADNDLVEVVQQCSELSTLIADDPAKGKELWATPLSSASPGQDVHAMVALYGADGVVTMEPGAETLFSRLGSPLARFPLNEENLWELDGSGNPALIEQDQAALSLQEFAPATGARLRQASLPDPVSPLFAGSSGTDTYLLASLPAPLTPATGLVVFDLAASRRTLFLLPVTDVGGLVAGPKDVYLTEVNPDTVTDSIVAYSRAGLDGAGTPSLPTAKNWPQACRILTAQQLSSLTGYTYAGYGKVIRADGLPPGSTCLYSTMTPGQSGVEVGVAWDGTSDAETASLTMQVASRMTPVANLGDQAYELVQNEPDVAESCEVVLRVGTVLVLVKSSTSTTLASAIAPAIAADLTAPEGG